MQAERTTPDAPCYDTIRDGELLELKTKKGKLAASLRHGAAKNAWPLVLAKQTARGIDV